MKTCKRCHEEKEEYYTVDYNEGIDPICADCRRAYSNKRWKGKTEDSYPTYKTKDGREIQLDFHPKEDYKEFEKLKRLDEKGLL